MFDTKEFYVKGMHCSGCEKTIEEALKKIVGVRFIKSDYLKSSVRINFDSEKTSLAQIQEVSAASGYTLTVANDKKNSQRNKIIQSFLALAGLALVIIIARNLGHKISLPEIDSAVSNGMIFIVGLLTSLHCIGMCGSFIIGYTSADTENGRSHFRSHLMYGAGKTISYALLGAFFGFIGSVFRITPLISGISISIAGGFLIIYGLKMVNIFSVLKAFRLKEPVEVENFVNAKRDQSKRPFFIGFFSGFILGCGPLQAMYVMAAGNGSALEGAKFLVLFGLGTLPALSGFGLLARTLSNRMTRRFVHSSGIILIILGSIMLNKGIIRAKSNGNIISTQPACQCQKMTDHNSEVK